MGTNFTPLNIAELEKKFGIKKKTGLSLDMILLIIGTLTAIVLAYILFILIQKKMQTPAPQPVQQVAPTLAPSPTEVPTPTIEATPTLPASSSATLSGTPAATPSGTLTPTATASPTLRPSP